MNKLLLSLLLLPCLAYGAVHHRGDFESATATGEIFIGAGPTNPADYNSFTRPTFDQGFFEIVNNPVRQGKYSARVWICDSTGSTGSCPYGDNEIRREKEKKAIDIKWDLASASLFNYGETRWIAFSLLHPIDRQFRAADKFPTVTEWFMNFQIMTERISLSQYTPSFGIIAAAGDSTAPWKMESSGRTFRFGDRERGVWHDFLIAYKPHHVDGQGLTTIKWRKVPLGGTAPEFTQVYTSTARSLTITMKGDENLGYSWGSLLYRNESQSGEHVMYFDGPWIADTEAEALQFFGDTPTQASLATPAVTLAWDGITWTQSGEGDVDDWTVQQCWDDRACTETTAATKTAIVSTPFGKSLLVRVRANPAVPATHSESAWGEDTELRTTPERPTNLALVQQSVTATAVTIPQTVTLSTTGTLDWVHWGLTSVSDVNRKAGATTLIGTMQPIGGGALLWSELGSSSYRPIMAWVNGTPTATEADTVNGVTYAYADAVAGSGFRLTAPATATTQRTLRMWVHANKTLARASVTQGATTTTLDFGSEAEQKAYMIAVPYLGTGQMQLDVTKTTVATGTGRLVLLGATLE